MQRSTSFSPGLFRQYEIFDGTGKQTAPTLVLFDTVKERDVIMKYNYQVPFSEKESKGYSCERIVRVQRLNSFGGTGAGYYPGLG